MADCKKCKLSEVKEVITFKFEILFFTENINLDKGGAYISKEHTEFRKSSNLAMEYCTPRIPTGTGAVERAVQTINN